MTGESNKSSSVGKTFLGVFVVVFALCFACYRFFGFEVALLLSLSLLTGAVMAGFVGVENIVIEELMVLRGEFKGYLLDMYAEMIKEDR